MTKQLNAALCVDGFQLETVGEMERDSGNEVGDARNDAADPSEFEVQLDGGRFRGLGIQPCGERADGWQPCGIGTGKAIP